MRGYLLEVLNNKFSADEKELLLASSDDGVMERFATKDGVTIAAIKARRLKLTGRLRRYLKAGQFNLYKKGIGGK